MAFLKAAITRSVAATRAPVLHSRYHTVDLMHGIGAWQRLLSATI